jgi:hypothetical protein
LWADWWGGQNHGAGLWAPERLLTAIDSALEIVVGAPAVLESGMLLPRGCNGMRFGRGCHLATLNFGDCM